MYTTPKPEADKITCTLKAYDTMIKCFNVNFEGKTCPDRLNWKENNDHLVGQQGTWLESNPFVVY